MEVGVSGSGWGSGRVAHLVRALWHEADVLAAALLARVTGLHDEAVTPLDLHVVVEALVHQVDEVARGHRRRVAVDLWAGVGRGGEGGR